MNFKVVLSFLAAAVVVRAQSITIQPVTPILPSGTLVTTTLPTDLPTTFSNATSLSATETSLPSDSLSITIPEGSITVEPSLTETSTTDEPDITSPVTSPSPTPTNGAIWSGARTGTAWTLVVGVVVALAV